MPIRKLQGLQGLKGLGSLSKAQYDDFINKNKDLISQHHYDPVYINKLYSNKLFIDKYGIDKFKAIPDAAMRSSLYREDIINEEFDKWSSPFNPDGTRDNKKGLGANYEKYSSQLSPDAKLEVLESGYLNPYEFETKWEKGKATYEKRRGDIRNNFLSSPSFILPGVASYNTYNDGMDAMYGEAQKQLLKERNDKILDKIYNKDIESFAKNNLAPQVAEAYKYWTGLNDEAIKSSFVKMITPGSYTDKNGVPNLGISEFASHYGDGSEKQVTSEMQDFSIDEMRQILAKKQVYDTYMPADMAATVLNNEAKRYINKHTGFFKREALLAKDIAITGMGYTADKLNGIGEIYRTAQDAFAEKPIVMVNDLGEVVDRNKVKLSKDNKGNVYYKDSNGNTRYVHNQQVSYTALHQMGKNSDGSDIEGAFGIDWMTLNPQFWNKAEQFGTLDVEEQKQYEKLGSSPYKMVYDPNDDTDFLWEGRKMIGFGLFDSLSQLVPWGIGSVGRILKTTSELGKVAQGFGKVLDTTGRLLSIESKTGQIVNGTVGALGIAHAYSRGSFQESLMENLANAEEHMRNDSRNEIWNKYNNNKEYKAAIDNQINALATKMKAAYMAQIGKDSAMRIADESAVDRKIHAEAQKAVLADLVDKKIEENKASQKYSDLQQKAIDLAGDVAINTFYPEALKYSYVNNFGFRKFLFTPSGVAGATNTSLKGLKEITTKEGLKRLATDASKSMTKKEKWKAIGKTAASQAWGGAWTNGTDDMQVDAAERINKDRFDDYLNAYDNGKSIADVYGFSDGLYSYFKGFQNSMGQATTADAATIGALGSLVSVGPNFVNLARLATKSGREAYKNNFWKEVVRDENGRPVKNEDGTIKYKDLGKWNNWREQANYFIQNGVLNTYYGNKQSERDLQSHADFVNNLLDEYKDFQDIEQLIASNTLKENFESLSDQKTMRFVQALHSINTLNNLAKNSNDPTSLSSVVQKAKTLIEKTSQLNLENDKNSFSEEEIFNLLSQYYAANPGLEQSEANNQKALYTIAENAQKLQEAAEALNEAEKEIQKIEKNSKEPLDPSVRTKLLISKALDPHWRERVASMKSEIDDAGNVTTDMSPEVTIATVGGRGNALKLINTYNRQEADFKEEIKKKKEENKKLEEEYNKVAEETKKARVSGDSDAIFKVTKAEKEAKAKLESSMEEEKFYADQLAITKDKRSKLQESINIGNVEGLNQEVVSIQKEVNKLERELESLKKEKESLKGSKNSEHNGNKLSRLNKIDKLIEEHEKEIDSKVALLNKKAETVLTADEIFNLDPVVRARMMDKHNRDLYSEAQQKEIEKLEKTLVMKDADALQKIQDIALLTQRIDANADAYNRVSSNPFAAAFAIESQRTASADAAYKLINYRNAQQCVDLLNTFIESDDFKNASKEDINDFVYKTLRTFNPNILDTIESEDLLPEYKEQLENAKKWSNVLNDISAASFALQINDNERSQVLDIIDNIIQHASTKEEAMSRLDTAIDYIKDPIITSSLDKILTTLEKQGYLRNAAIVENRKQRQQREEEEKKKKEEEERKAKQAEEEAKKAAEKAVEKKKAEEEKKNEEITDRVPTPEDKLNKIDDVDLEGPSDAPIEDEVKETKARTVDEDNLNQVSSNELNGKAMMEDNFGNGSINMGDMWYKAKDDSKKAPFVVSKEGNKISFTTDGKNDTLSIAPNEYEVVTDKQETKKNAVFNANSMEKIDEDWYFNGNFAGETNNTQVKVSKDFDIDKAIERQQAAREAELAANDAATNDIVDNKNIIDNGDTIEAKSPSIDEQMEDESLDKDNISVSDVNVDAADLNSKGEYSIENSVTTLSGNAMDRYVKWPLEEKGEIVLKKGKEEGDLMNQFYAWMDAAGIKLQNIIDFELGRIINANPHAKVKFLVVNPIKNATNDKAMENHLLLVLDYDNNINKNITSIHNDANGGVIDFNGKKYLVIGVAGYGKAKFNTDRQKLWYRIWNKNSKLHGDIGLIIPKRTEYLRKHPKERFYVAEDYTTEVVNYYPTPGYIVRQAEKDSESTFRSVRELLADKDRNPYGIDFNKVAWGIQEQKEFLVVNESANNVMVPRNVIENLGRAFVLMPASNGKLVPSYLKVLKYNEMRDGVLKDKVISLLQSVTSPNYTERYEALKGLFKIFYFSKEGDNLLVGKEDRNTISLVHDGKIFKTFTLDSNFDRGEFMTAFEDMNPRVNITAKVLSSKKALNDYDEAGALMTDAAIFGTVGSSYQIYALDEDGKMIMPSAPKNPVPKASDSTFRKEATQVIFNGQYYRYEDGQYTLGSKEINDEKIVKQLDYNRMVAEGKLISALKKDVWDYYILETGEHPKVIKIHENTKEVKEATEEQARQLIDKLNEEKVKKQREEEAKKSLEKTAPINTEDVPFEDNGLEIDPNTGEIIQAPEETPTSEEEEKGESATNNEKEETVDVDNTTTESPNIDEHKDSTQTLSELLNNFNYMRRVITLIRDKWKDAPKKVADLEKFLKDKNIEVDAIGTSKEDVEAWIKTIEDCR